MPKAKSADEQYLDGIRAKSAFHRLCYWIEERESIRLKKEAGEKAPWTPDPILQSYRFTCPRRMDDRVSKWLLGWYQKDHHNIVPAVVLGRFINKPDSLAALEPEVFCKGKPNLSLIERKLRYHHEAAPVFNGAYIIPPGKGKDKIDSVVNYVCKGVVTEPVNIDTASIQNTHTAFMERDGFGSFMAGQVCHDLSYVITGTWTDRYTWAPYGPGSIKGMDYLMRDEKGNVPKYNFLDEIRSLRDRLQYSLPEDLFGKLDMMDIQNTLCEGGKYFRTLEGTGKPKQLYNGRG